MKRLTMLLTCFLIQLFFVKLDNCLATEINTKLFIDDLQKCENFIKIQHQLITNFLDSLTPHDVELINSQSDIVNFENQGISEKSLGIFMKIISTSPPKPEGVKYDQYPKSGIPRNLLNGSVQNVSNIGIEDGIINGYKIPESDYKEVITKYSDYTIFLLDKIQTLTDKVNSIGMTIYTFPRINGKGIVTGDFLIFFTKIYNPLYSELPGEWLKSELVSKWNTSCANIPELETNKSALTAHKLWIEFVLSNSELLVNRGGTSYKEAFLRDQDNTNKLLAKLDNVNSQSSNIAGSDKENIISGNATETKSAKFKLALPE